MREGGEGEEGGGRGEGEGEGRGAEGEGVGEEEKEEDSRRKAHDPFLSRGRWSLGTRSRPGRTTEVESLDPTRYALRYCK